MFMTPAATAADTRLPLWLVPTHRRTSIYFFKAK
jgi:hypothetical protein